MKKVVYLLTILLSICILPQQGCMDKSSKLPPLPTEQFADGDLAFRRGVGLTSHIVLAAEDGNGMYSHVGIIKLIDGKCYVIHSVPDEPDFEGDIDRVKIEPIEEFFAPEKAVKGVVMRYSGNSQANLSSAQVAMSVAERRTPFDHKYDLTDTTEMYCSEMVDFAYRKAGVDLSEGRRSRLDVPVYGGVYLMPDDLIKNSKMEVIYKFTR